MGKLRVILNEVKDLGVVFLAVVFILLTTSSAYAIVDPPRWDAAQKATAESRQQRKPEPEHIPPVLQYIYRHDHRHQSIFSIQGGNYTPAHGDSTYGVGARYVYFPNNVFAFGGTYRYAPLHPDPTSNFGSAIRSNNMNLISAIGMYNNPVAFRAGNSVLEADMYLTFGGGGAHINADWTWLGMVGGGMRFLMPKPWLAIEVDVESFFHPIPGPSGYRFAADVDFMVGLAFMFPPKKPHSTSEGK